MEIKINKTVLYKYTIIAPKGKVFREDWPKIIEIFGDEAKRLGLSNKVLLLESVSDWYDEISNDVFEDLLKPILLDDVRG